MNAVCKEGYDAFDKKIKLEDNPYKGQVDKESQWADGWEDAKMDADIPRPKVCSEHQGLLGE